MRPKEFWEKPFNGGNGKGKRINNSKKQRSASTSATVANNTSNATAMYSDASSPASDGGQMDEMEVQPQLPVMRHRRVSSDQLISPQSKSKSMDEAAALAALKKAIKSSPHKFAGSKDMPVSVDNLTPQPTRRILFPTPSQSRERHSKRDSSTISEVHVSQDSPSVARSVEVNDQANKENCPPTEIEETNHRRQKNRTSQPRSKTPTPPNPGKAVIFKTPVRSPRKPPPTTGDFFSSAAKALLRPPSTPKRTPTKDIEPLGELTPFTIHLNQLLSDANNASPGSQDFDFPSLPSLRNTPGRSTRTLEFDFSNFDSQDLLSTDVPMPSSPPIWFGVYEDPIEHESSTFWGDHQATHPTATPTKQISEISKDSKTSGLVVDENGRATVAFQGAS